MSVEAKYMEQSEVLECVDTAEGKLKRAEKLVRSGQKDAINTGIVVGNDTRIYKPAKKSKLQPDKRHAIKKLDTKTKLTTNIYAKNRVDIKGNKVIRREKSSANKKKSKSSVKLTTDELKASQKVSDSKIKPNKVSKKSLATGVVSASLDVAGEGEEFDEVKSIKGNLSSANQVRQSASKITKSIQARRAKAVQESVKATERTVRAAQASSAAKATAGAGGKVAAAGGATAGGIAGLPIILVVLLILVGISVIIALCSIFTSLMSSKSNTGSLTGIEKEIAEALMAEGYDKIHTAAIMGNMSIESSFNPKSLQEGGEREYLSGDERSNWQGYGLNQMTNGRKENLCSLADSRNTPHCDIASQVKYFCTPAEKAESNWNKSRWKSYDCVPITRWQWEGMKDNLDLLTTALMAFWERPNEDPAINHISKRIEEAWRIYNALNSSGGDGTIVGEAQAIADDDSHGYSQNPRELNPDVDCSSFVFYSLQHAGFGLSGYPFNTGGMRDVLLPLGFQEIAYTGLSGCQPGDVLWSSGHTEIYAGDGMSIGAHQDYDGRSGDSSGQEVNKGSADQGWSLIYRPPAR